MIEPWEVIEAVEGNIEIAERLLPSESAEPSTLSGPKRTRILYVEDDADTRELVTLMLAREGYEVVTAGTLADSQRCAEASPFDCYIIDNTLPDGSGVSLCQKLRALNADARILFCSGWSTEKHITAASDNGAQDYLTKPFTTEELLAKVSHLIR